MRECRAFLSGLPKMCWALLHMCKKTVGLVLLDSKYYQLSVSQNFGQTHCIGH